MSNGGQGTAGKTRTCPHCRATILQSSTVCPICRKSLRWDPHTEKHKAPSFSALRVEGAVKHPAAEEPWEYSLMVIVKNEKGEEITRQMVGVGSLQSAEQRTFTLSVEVFTSQTTGPAKAR
jgi:hypothetical protein